MSVCPVCPVCNVGVLWPNGWMDHDETWHASRPRSLPHCIVPDPLPQRGKADQCCGQMDKWIKMPLCREVGLDPSVIVLDGYPARPPQKGAELPPPNFRSMSIVTKRLGRSR